MSAYKWISAVCDEETTQSNITTPWLAEIDGAPTTVATNGQIMVFVPGEHGFSSRPDAPDLENILKTLPASGPMPFPLARLKELVEEAVKRPELADCMVCKNTGNVECNGCAGQGEAECQCDCGHLHDAECEDCDGDGEVPCPECPRGDMTGDDKIACKIGIGAFDLRLFARVAPHLEGDAMWAQDDPNRCALLTAGNVRVLVMPLRKLDDMDGYQRYEVKYEIDMTEAIAA